MDQAPLRLAMIVRRERSQPGNRTVDSGEALLHPGRADQRPTDFTAIEDIAQLLEARKAVDLIGNRLHRARRVLAFLPVSIGEILDGLHFQPRASCVGWYPE